MSTLARLWFVLGWRYVAAAAVATAVCAVAIGVPTDVLPNPWFTRMTPVRPLDLLLWPMTSVLVGALLATYLRKPGTEATGVAPASSLLGSFAVGCPICNKLVVAALGVSGAVTYFGPLQPVLGAAAVLLAAWALRVRLRSLLEGCPVGRRGGASLLRS